MKNDHINFVRTYFSVNAQKWKDLYHKADSANYIVLRNRKNIAVSFLLKYLKRGSKILDVGCGAGVVSIDIVQRGFFVYGIDISSKMIALCNQTFSQARIDTRRYIFSVDDFTNIDIPDNSFDAIIALGFLEYQKDEHSILKKFQKIIKPGGILICSGPMKIKLSNYFGFGSLLILVYKVIGSKFSKKILPPTPFDINKYSLGRFKKLMTCTGFNLIDYKRHGYSDFVVLNKVIGPKGNILMHYFFTKISKFLPIDRWASDIIVVAKKY